MKRSIRPEGRTGRPLPTRRGHSGGRQPNWRLASTLYIVATTLLAAQEVAKQPGKSRHNHYVPVWYQRQFMAPDVDGLFYFDLDAARSSDPIKRKLVERALPPLPPSRCFSQLDLYTTVFAGIPNDEIERLLFGAIDNDGAIATRAFAANDVSMITRLFRQFFDYMSAQKLRTPKGLDWIRANYPKLSQLDLMLELQALRQMSCTMWFECVREVVSAADSSVKFIVSDHPVVTFNGAVSLEAPDAAYPQEPPVDWKGTQTLLPLDSNKCLILTNLEYAMDPALTDMTSKRTHARHFGESIARTDNTIYGRKLSDADVRCINRLIASRAKRYLGAADRGWLQDAIAAPADLQRVAEVLRPAADELWHYGGTTYVGFADGTSRSWDEFGRTEPEREFLRKRPPDTPPAPSDACPCGNGRLFGECCDGRDARDTPPWDLWSLRERNLRFIDAVSRVLGLSEGKTWVDVRREISAEQVRTIHVLFEGLWPADVDLSALLPRPDSRRLRALYLGVVDARLVSLNVLGWLPYFDEIVVLNPFLNARHIRSEYSPIASPDQHKAQTLKNVMLLMMLQPFIQRGWVHLIPDPMELNPTIRQMIMDFGERYRSTRGNSQLQDRELEFLARDDFERSMLQCSDNSLRAIIKESSPELPSQQIERTLEFMKQKREMDPYALLQGSLGGRGDMITTRGVSIPIGLFLASLTGSLPYTDMNLWWKNLTDFAAGTNPSEPPSMAAIAEAVRSARVLLDPNPENALWLRDVEAVVAWRDALRAMWKVLCRGDDDSSLLEQIALQIRELGKSAYEAARSVDPGRRSEVRIERTLNCLIPPEGLSLREAHRMLLAFGHGRHVARLPFALVGHTPMPIPEHHR
jgi:hypothetical protein